MNDQRPRVVFQGERGAYSEEAAVQFFGEDIEPLPRPTFDQVFDDVTQGIAEHGIVPVENSLAGSIHRNYDLLLRHDLHIIGETAVRVVHSLIVHPGVTIEKVRRVYSHPQALAQCEHSLSRWPDMELISTYDTAGSVKMIKEKGIVDGAAIASRRAAAIYDMQIVVEGLEDNEENFTRFMVLSRQPVKTNGPSKTSLVYSMVNTPGALFKTLAVFALREIDLTKIESRPLQGKPWEYFFYVDLAAGMHEERCQNALSHLKEVTAFLRILGSYPRGV